MWGIIHTANTAADLLIIVGCMLNLLGHNILGAVAFTAAAIAGMAGLIISKRKREP